MGRSKYKKPLEYEDIIAHLSPMPPCNKKILSLQLDVTSGLNNILADAGYYSEYSHLLEAADACANAQPRLICKKAYDLCKKLNKDANKIKHPDVVKLVTTFSLDYMKYLGYNPY